MIICPPCIYCSHYAYNVMRKSDGGRFMKSIVLAVSPSERKQRFRVRRIALSLSYYIKKYGLISFFVFLLLAGIVSGASYCGAHDNALTDKVIKYIMDRNLMRDDPSVIGVFADSFTISFVFAAVCVLMSLSPFGVITIPTVIFARGFYCGVISGYLCVTYGIKGLWYYICVVLIGAFLSSLALVYISQYCMNFSASIVKEIFHKSQYKYVALRDKLFEVILNTSFMIILIGFASLADTVLFFLVGGMFKF